MNIDDLLIEIENYEREGKFVLADKLSNRLYSYAIQFQDTISKMDGSAVFGYMQKQRLLEEIYQYMKHPSCNKCFSLGLTNQMQVVGDFKDMAASASQAKTPEKQREEYNRFLRWFNETEVRLTDFPENVSEEGRLACRECLSLIKKGELEFNKTTPANPTPPNVINVPNVNPGPPPIPPRVQ